MTSIANTLGSQGYPYIGAMYNINLIYKVQIYCVSNCVADLGGLAEVLGEEGVQQASLRIELSADLAVELKAIGVQLFAVFSTH